METIILLIGGICGLTTFFVSPKWAVFDTHYRTTLRIFIALIMGVGVVLVMLIIAFITKTLTKWM